MFLSGHATTLRQIIIRSSAQIMFCAVACVSLVTAASGVVVLRGYAARENVLIAGAVSYAIEPAIVFGDPSAIRRGMLAAADLRDLNAIEISKPDGTVLAMWRRVDTRWSDRITYELGTLLWPTPVTHLVSHDNAVLAVVRVFGGVGGILPYMLLGLGFTTASVLFTLLASGLLARQIHRVATTPLTRLAEVARSVRVNRDFNRRATLSGLTEIDDLAGHFNALLDELADWHSGLALENERLLRQVTLDELTGLGNRGLFDEALHLALAGALNTGTPFALLVLDVDNFKAVNDSLGHVAGDAVLRTVARRLTDTLGEADRAYRLGGDEFAILLCAPPDARNVQITVARIAAAMAVPTVLATGDSCRISLSVGAAVYPDDAQDVEGLLAKADARMYRNKRERSATQEGPIA